jgi:hypothetical protein
MAFSKKVFVSSGIEQHLAEAIFVVDSNLVSTGDCVADFTLVCNNWMKGFDKYSSHHFFQAFNLMCCRRASRQ